MATQARGLLRGLVVGLCATEALDWLSIALYQGESRKSRRKENAVRGHRHAYERAIEREPPRASAAVSATTKLAGGDGGFTMFGLLGGPGYLALRRRFPALRWGCGLGFGAVFFLVVDELLVPLNVARRLGRAPFPGRCTPAVPTASPPGLRCRRRRDGDRPARHAQKLLS